MATADKTIRFVVSSSAAAIPPNTVQLVGTGSEQTAGARPSGFSAAQWTSTVFYQYSGGCFVPGWGTHGCWAGVGHGGHAAGTNNNVDACIFDFADYSFKWLPNTNGVTHAPTMWTEAQTDGAPLYALSGTSQLRTTHTALMSVSTAMFSRRTVSMGLSRMLREPALGAAG
jgi:hypothetical protein